MKREAFTLENLKHLDFGRIGVAFNGELKRVVQDCMDRPVDKRPRKVLVEFKVVPQIDASSGHADCEEVSVECEVQSSVPKRRTKIYRMVPTADGQLAFHPDLPDEPEGSALYDEDVIDREKRKE